MVTMQGKDKVKIILHKLQSEFKLAIGCADPVAIAYAVAKTKEMLKHKQIEHLKKIEVLSP